MRIALIGATGTIGRAVHQLLASRHTVIAIGHRSGAYTLDLADPAAVRALIDRLAAQRLDAIVCAAGRSRRGLLGELSDDDFAFSLANKLMGQVNLVRAGFARLADLGSVTLTSGMLGTQPARGTAAVSLVNAALEGFVRAAAMEAPRGIRVNIVSPGWVTETLLARGQSTRDSVPVARVADAYLACVEGSGRGQVIEVRAGASE